MANLKTGNYSNLSVDQNDQVFNLIKLQLLMQSEQPQLEYTYEQKNEFFPEMQYKSTKNSEGIGKILTRYRNNKQQQPDSMNTYLQGRNLPVHSGTGLNYSQIYNDLRLDKTPSNLSRNHEGQKIKTNNGDGAQTPMSKSPYNFQSALELGNRYSISNKKVLPGIIVHGSKNNQSQYGKEQADQQQQRKNKINRSFRISEIKDKSDRKPNYHEISDINIYGMEENKSQYLSNANKESQSAYSSMRNTGRNPNDSNLAEIKQERQLSNSRSVGVGNHKIDQKDLQYVQETQLQPITPPQIQKITQRGKKDGKGQQINKNKDFQETPTNLFNPQKYDNEDQKSQAKIQSQKNKSKEHKRSSSLKQEQNETPEVVIHYQQSQNEESIEPVTNGEYQTQAKQKMNGNELQGQKQKGIQKSGISKNQIQVSRIASTIKPVKQEIMDRDNDGQLNLNFEPTTDQASDNILIGLRQSQPKEEIPQEPLGKDDYGSTFNIQQYTKIYDVLKSIQTALKCSVVNVQELLKSIKNYLELIASGNLDSIDQFDLPLHKKKIIKNSLFFERVAIVVLAFAYTTHNVKQSLRYLLNIIGYSLNNCLILVKILQETQINDITKKSKISGDTTNPVIQKSDRLVMKRNLDTLRNNNNVLLDTIQKLSKSEETFSENLTQIIKTISKCSLQQTFYNLLQYFSFYLCVSQLDHMIPFLAVAPNPYLAPVMSNCKYTLVIDVVQIFCYGTKKSKTNIFRPYSQHFLNEMSQYYDIISFCPGFPNQVDKVIDVLDPKQLIEHRLYKHHTINNNKQNLKYLDRIGRDINEMILLDNQNSGGQGSYENCIHVPNWRGNKNDTILAQLCPLLAMIALKKIPAPEAAKKVREQSTKNRKEGVKYINFGISLD